MSPALTRRIAIVAGLCAIPSLTLAQTPSPAPPADAPKSDEPAPSADASGAREVTLEPRSILMLRGESTWDDGYESLTGSFATLRNEAKRLGLGVTGKPQAAFQETDDQRFKYDAMVFLDREPDGQIKPQGNMTIGKSPAGKAYVFSHTGAYDDIDSVYEAITAWLDEKGLTSKGAFIEEYLNEPQGSDDAKLELNIYVFIQ